jgi:hypothetical protein
MEGLGYTVIGSILGTVVLSIMFVLHDLHK